MPTYDNITQLHKWKGSRDSNRTFGCPLRRSDWEEKPPYVGYVRRLAPLRAKRVSLKVVELRRTLASSSPTASAPTASQRRPGSWRKGLANSIARRAVGAVSAAVPGTFGRREAASNKRNQTGNINTAFKISAQQIKQMCQKAIFDVSVCFYL